MLFRKNKIVLGCVNNKKMMNMVWDKFYQNNMIKIIQDSYQNPHFINIILLI